MQAKRSPIDRAKKAKIGKGGDFVGDLISWDFGDNAFSVPRARVREVFERFGFHDCVEAVDEIDPGTALGWTLRSGAGVKKGRGIVIDALDAHRKDTPAAVAIYRKETKQGESGDDWVGGARVRIDPTSNRAVALPLEGQSWSDERTAKIAEQVAERANEFIVNVMNTELSLALTAAGRQILWAPFRRKKGGAWFVYADNAAVFRGLLDELEKFGGFEPTIEPQFVDGEGRVERNVKRASEYTLEKELVRLKTDLDKAQKDGMRPSALERRVAECDELLARADLYKSMLREAADGIAKRIDGLKKNFAQELDGGDSVFDDIDKVLGGKKNKHREQLETLGGNGKPKKATTKTKAKKTESTEDEDPFTI